MRVTKQWLLLESRRFLVEEVPVAALEPQWRTLPAAVARAIARVFVVELLWPVAAARRDWQRVRPAMGFR